MWRVLSSYPAAAASLSRSAALPLCRANPLAARASFAPPCPVHSLSFRRSIVINSVSDLVIEVAGSAIANALTKTPRKRKPKAAAAAAAPAEAVEDGSEPKSAKPTKPAKQPKAAAAPKPKKPAKAVVPAEAKERVKQLRKQIKAANQVYYAATSKSSGLSDAEFDALFKELQEIELAHPSLLTATSPTQKPGASTSSNGGAVQHLLPMLSLQSTTSVDEVRLWDASLKRRLGLAADSKLAYMLERKYDGIAVSAIYRHGRLQRVLTRGDGTEGEDVTASVARWVVNLPATLDTAALPAEYRDATVEVRGEVLLTTSAHKAYATALRAGDATAEADDAPLTPARNITAGLLRRDQALESVPASAGPKAPLCFVAFSLLIHHPTVRHTTPYLIPPEGAVKGEPQSFPPSQSEAISLLQAMGVPVAPVPASGVASSASSASAALRDRAHTADIDSALDVLSTFVGARDQLDFAIDGVVLKLDSLELAHDAGATSHHPQAILAFKFAAKSVETTLRSVTWQVGRVGKVVPVAELTPVALDGVQVKRASLHNVATLQELDLSEGDVVRVERRGDVIPFIAGKADVQPAGKRTPVCIPSECPCAERSKLRLQPTASDASRMDLYCVSPSCPTQQLAKIEYYCSRVALDIEGMGGKTVQQLIDHGFVHDLGDVVDLPSKRQQMHALAAAGDMPSWGATRIDKVCDNVERAHEEATEEQLLIAVGIPRLAGSQARVLIERFGSLEAILEAKEEELKGLKGCGGKLAPTFIAAFADLKSGIVPHWRKRGVLEQARKNSGSAVKRAPSSKKAKGKAASAAAKPDEE